ncbi:MAG: hypothetical protein ACMV1B_12475 [Prevotella sp.]
MSIRKNTNPRSMDLQPELQDILMRNGMQAHIVGSSNGFQLVVQGHDSPVLSYNISKKQLEALTDWGTNFSNKKAYNTFTSLVANDFDMPKNFVHARNANGRVAMGLHGYRIGVGEYGRETMNMPFHHRHGWSGMCMGRPIPFLGWTPRQQDGFHMRRIGGELYYPGAPMVPNRPDGRMKPRELQNGSYGFYYKGAQVITTQPAQDVLKDLQSVIQPVVTVPREQKTATPYNEAITSKVYFSNDKWQDVLASHGIIIDEKAKMVTIQSAASPADLQYTLTDEELKALTNNSIKEVPIDKRLNVLNGVIGEDFKDAVTMEMLNSNKSINIQLSDKALAEINTQLGIGNPQQVNAQQPILEVGENQEIIHPELGPLAQGGIRMDGNDLEYIDENKGWFREGRHGREVSVDEIRVEPITNNTANPSKETEQGKAKEHTQTEGKYKMTAIIDGQVISHEITQKQFDKFMAVDDYHRMKLFSKVFPEVDMKSRGDGVGLGTKIGAALLAGVTVAGELGHAFHHRPAPDIFMEHHRGPESRAYFKPGVDTPMDVAARNFEAAANTEMMRHDLQHGR